MKITFSAEKIRVILEHSKNAPKHRKLYEQPETDQPGLWIVGDTGVYLMSNGIPGIRQDKSIGEIDMENHAFVVYPQEFMSLKTPTEIDALKRACWGGDDSVVLLTAEFIVTLLKQSVDGFCCLEIKPEQIQIVNKEEVANVRR
jgi:hypothetical protein